MTRHPPRMSRPSDFNGRHVQVMSLAQLKKERMVQQVKREIEIHASLRHKNILRLHGFFYDVHNVYIVRP